MLSQFLNKPAPLARWPKFTENAFKTDAFAYLPCCPYADGAGKRSRCGRIRRDRIGQAANFAAVAGRPPTDGRIGAGSRGSSGSAITSAPASGGDYSGFGDRADYNGNWLERAAAALAGIWQRSG